MHDILRNIDESKQTKWAWIMGLSLTIYISAFMVSSSMGEVDDQLILDMNPMLLLVLQGVVSFFLFIVASLLAAKVALQIGPSDFFPSFSARHFGMTLIIALCFMVVNSAIAEWNLQLDFPDSSFETWAKRSEEQLKVFTEYLTDFTTPGHFIMALIVIAVIPAIGEELLFRGLIQNLFAKGFNNHHLAIWVTGFIFSAIHMQFYGFFPRMLLGVLFGYLYFWSGKLSLAMLAHFFNNGLALFTLYISKQGWIALSSEQMESAAPWPMVLLFGLVGTVILRLFHQQSRANL